MSALVCRALAKAMITGQSRRARHTKDTSPQALAFITRQARQRNASSTQQARVRFPQRAPFAIFLLVKRFEVRLRIFVDTARTAPNTSLLTTIPITPQFLKSNHRADCPSRQCRSPFSVDRRSSPKSLSRRCTRPVLACHASFR